MSLSSSGRVMIMVVGISWVSLFAQERPHLSFADPVQLVDCQPVSTIPCFTTSFNIVNDSGEPYGVDLPGTDQLLTDLTITADGVPVKVFYVSTGGSKQSVRGRLALVLVDISGSMARKLASGETRFQAAQAALRQFVDSFQDNVDEVAIVPFESHNVASTIRAASFAHTKNDALAQVNSIPDPQRHNNTALYSAVSLGLDVLNDHTRALQTRNNSYAPETMLIVMTDGMNEVFAGDDAGLLNGPEGLEQAAQKVSSSRLQVIGIGFGDKSEVDLGALKRISTKGPYMATDADDLKRIFAFTRKLLVDRIQVAFLSPSPDRPSLAGRTITFQGSLQLPGGLPLTSNEAVFGTPQMGLPLFSGKADGDELAALNTQMKSNETGWLTLLRPVFVFLGLGGMLLIAWFWIPRLVWPGQYIGSIALAKPAGRWANPSRPGQRPVQAPKNTPLGFEPGKAGAGQRTPQDATVVQPGSDSTKIRLHRDFRR
jgi:Ca-activated chloride channel family protein